MPSLMPSPVKMDDSGVKVGKDTIHSGNMGLEELFNKSGRGEDGAEFLQRSDNEEDGTDRSSSESVGYQGSNSTLVDKKKEDSANRRDLARLTVSYMTRSNTFSPPAAEAAAEDPSQDDDTSTGLTVSFWSGRSVSRDENDELTSDDSISTTSPELYKTPTRDVDMSLASNHLALSVLRSMTKNDREEDLDSNKSLNRSALVSDDDKTGLVDSNILTQNEETASLSEDEELSIRGEALFNSDLGKTGEPSLSEASGGNSDAEKRDDVSVAGSNCDVSQEARNDVTQLIQHLGTEQEVSGASNEYETEDGDGEEDISIRGEVLFGSDLGKTGEPSLSEASGGNSDVEKRGDVSFVGSNCGVSQEARNDVPQIIHLDKDQEVSGASTGYETEEDDVVYMGKKAAKKLAAAKEIGVQVNQITYDEALERINELEATAKALRQDQHYVRRMEMRNHTLRQHSQMIVKEMAMQNLRHIVSSNQFHRQLSMLKANHRMLLSEKLAMESSQHCLEWENADLRAENVELKAKIELDSSLFIAAFQKQAGEILKAICLIVLFLFLGLSM